MYWLRVIAALLVGLLLSSCARHMNSFDQGVIPKKSTTVTRTISKQATSETAALNVPAYVGEQRIALPYPEAGVGSTKDLATFESRMVRCTTAPYSTEIDENRIVEIGAPPSANLADKRLANTILVNAIHFAQMVCPPGRRIFAVPKYSGIAVTVIQNGEMVIKTGQTDTFRTGNIAFVYVKNIAAERAARLQAAQRSAEASERFWSKVRSGFLIIIALVGLGLLIRYASPIYTRVTYWFFPHPAIAQIRQATHSRSPAPINGNALADALDYQPRNAIEGELIRRDIEWMKAKAQKHHDLQVAKTELAKKVTEMERARVRVETLEKWRST